MTFSARTLQRWFEPLQHTPIHPQFLVLRHRGETTNWINEHARGTLLDIGCGNSRLSETLPATVRYIGIDYPGTISLGYAGRPDIHADAARLPFSTASIDTIALLDVLEHLADPDQAISEASRVLRSGGKCLIHVPFLYPLHDEPHDYRRWTRYGLVQLLQRHGLEPEQVTETITPIETSAALLSMALSKAMIDAAARKHPALLLAPLLLLVPIINVCAWGLGKLLPTSNFMPFSYRVVASLRNTTSQQQGKGVE